MSERDLLESILMIERLASRLIQQQHHPFLNCNIKQILALLKIIQSEVFINEERCS